MKERRERPQTLKSNKTGKKRVFLSHLEVPLYLFPRQQEAKKGVMYKIANFHRLFLVTKFQFSAFGGGGGGGGG
jgi:hypothetical protein